MLIAIIVGSSIVVMIHEFYMTFQAKAEAKIWARLKEEHHG